MSISVCRPANAQPFGTMAAAPFGSSLILPISFAYISLMGSEGLREASKLAILKANYMAKRLGQYYPVLYTGPAGTCAHEFILDVRPLEQTAGTCGGDIFRVALALFCALLNTLRVASQLTMPGDMKHHQLHHAHACSSHLCCRSLLPCPALSRLPWRPPLLLHLLLPVHLFISSRIITTTIVTTNHQVSRRRTLPSA